MTNAEQDVCDYLVIGAGSAGSVVASRLSEDPNVRVTLVEAGSDPTGFWVPIPLGIAKLFAGDRLAWRFHTVPQEAMKGQRIFWPRGKALGGSSSINGMVWTRGDRKTYDHFASLGCDGWGWDEMQPYLNKIESFEGAIDQRRGRMGPINVSMVNADDDLTQAFIKSLNETGVASNADGNDGDQYGVWHLQFSILNGRRCSTYTAYLKPALNRPNLRVLKDTLAERLILDGRRVVGAQLSGEGGQFSVKARREVILCAGSLKTPHILELSGIGQAERLRSLGIDVVHDAPELGENLSDHVNVRMSYRARQAITLNDVMASRIKMLLCGMRYMLFRKGFLAIPPATVHAITPLIERDRSSTVKIQYSYISGHDRYANTPQAGVDKYSGFNIGTFQIYPKSRGFVHASSPDPKVDPDMSANYFADEYDRQLAVRQLNMIRLLAKQSPLASEIVEETRPGKDLIDESDLLDYALESGQTSWHQVGSARMGSDDRSVVDLDLRVRGVEGVRVVDASVWPEIPASNTNAPTIALAERAVDLIRRA